MLDRTAPLPLDAPDLDAEQRRVVAHRGGPLLVLAGPGTGKTTTLVEAMVARLSGPDPLHPDQVLGLTFGRRAAQEWRARVTARLGGGLVPQVATFHSFAYALVREHADPVAYAEPLRLLSGPEQELRLRELLTGSVRDGRLDWPPELAAALGTRGLAAEVRAVVAQARALGLDPTDLESLASGAGALGPAWRAVGQFLGEYLDVLDAEGVTDYTEVVHRAALLAHDPHVQPGLHARYRAVFVDEYQDTDPAQVRLLAGLVAPGAELVVVGDPDQSIYAFRGADARGILTFRERFRAPDGSPAPVVVLTRTRRFGPVLREAAGRVLRSAALGPLPADVVRAHRSPVCEGAAYGDGRVEVRTFDSESAEAGHIADALRRAHLEQGVPWDDMAVLVRSGRRSVGPMRRALAAAGVPVEVAGDELPLHEEPAVAPLLAMLAASVDPHHEDPAALDETAVHDLLLSPLADADPADLRRLGRALRRVEREADPAARPTPSATLLRRLLLDLAADPAAPVPVSESSSGRDARARFALAAVRRLARLLRDARAVVERHGGTEEVLWAVWSGCAARGGSGWPHRLESAALRGGEAGRRADADLDAVLALFAAAERVEDRFGGRRGVANFLAELREQQIPADTLAERGLRGPAVRLLTAHRAKGLQWRLVVVAGVQEGAWPDVRRRGSLLQPDRLHVSGLVAPPPPAALLAEERRLFYVACTRAQERLMVTAVRSVLDDGPQPSRFLDEIAGHELGPADHLPGRPARPLSVAGLVAQLRATAADPDRPPALREAAVRRLAVLASAEHEGRALVPAARPEHWWGLAEPTSSGTPVRPLDEPLAFSGSQLQAMTRCPLQWFLGHEVHGEVARTTALGFGSIVHVIADAVAREQLPPDPDALDERIDQVWSELGFEAVWQSRSERVAASEAVRRFLAWHDSRPDRTFLASEHKFEVTVAVGERGVALRGSFDRVEVDADGAVRIADLKTQKSKLRAEDLPQHPQMGVYQVAVREGALRELPAELLEQAGLAGPPESPPVGGAELVLLRLGKGGQPEVQPQPPIGDGLTWVDVALHEADSHVRTESFPARPGESCRFCSFRRACPGTDEGREVLP
ncbi:MAG: AAA family ATPase [Frankiales bacterium]|nr:AAA family ATPase [Frankiales bacterium]